MKLFYQPSKPKLEPLQSPYKCGRSSVPIMPHYSKEHHLSSLKNDVFLSNHIHIKGIAEVWIVYEKVI